MSTIDITQKKFLCNLRCEDVKNIPRADMEKVASMQAMLADNF